MSSNDEAVRKAEAAFAAARAAMNDARTALYLALMKASPIQKGDKVAANIGVLRGIGPGPWHPVKVVELDPSDLNLRYRVVPLTKEGKWSNVDRLVTDAMVRALPVEELEMLPA